MPSLFAFGTGFFNEINREREQSAINEREDQKLEKQQRFALEQIDHKTTANTAAVLAKETRANQKRAASIMSVLGDTVSSLPPPVQQLISSQLENMDSNAQAFVLKAFTDNRLKFDPKTGSMSVEPVSLTKAQQIDSLNKKLFASTPENPFNSYDKLQLDYLNGRFGTADQEFYVARQQYDRIFANKGPIGGLVVNAPDFGEWLSATTIIRKSGKTIDGWQTLRKRAIEAGILAPSSDNMVSTLQSLSAVEPVAPPAVTPSPQAKANKANPNVVFEAGDPAGSEGSIPGSIQALIPTTPKLEAIKKTRRQKSVDSIKSSVQTIGEDATIAKLIAAIENGGSKSETLSIASDAGISTLKIRRRAASSVPEIADVREGSFRERAFGGTKRQREGN